MPYLMLQCSRRRRGVGFGGRLSAANAGIFGGGWGALRGLPNAVEMGLRGERSRERGPAMGSGQSAETG